VNAMGRKREYVTRCATPGRMRLRLVIVAVALVGLLPSYVPAEVREGDVTARIMGKDYRYHYRVYEPPKELKQAALGEVQPDTPLHALQVFGALARARKVAEWQDRWLPKDRAQLKQIPDSKWLEIWDRTASRGVLVKYEIEYRDRTVFVLCDATAPQGPSSGTTLTRVGALWFGTNDLADDPFYQIIGLSTFDPETGRYVIRPIAYYEFEQIEPKVVDTSSVVLGGGDHSIQYGENVGVRSVQGWRGKAGGFDGKAFVRLPAALELSVPGNVFLIDLWVQTAKVPLAPENRMDDGEYAGTILSRGTGGESWSVTMQVRRPADTSKESHRIVVQVGAGKEQFVRSGPIEVGKWIHVQARFNKDQLEMRIGGRTVTDGQDPPAGTKPQLSRMEPILLGKGGGKPSLPFVGSIDELRIWNEEVPWEHTGT
jgi:hypothetical protein